MIIYESGTVLLRVPLYELTILSRKRCHLLNNIELNNN